jgi:Nuclear cap-binding protein subunit 3
MGKLVTDVCDDLPCSCENKVAIDIVAVHFTTKREKRRERRGAAKAALGDETPGTRCGCRREHRTWDLRTVFVSLHQSSLAQRSTSTRFPLPASFRLYTLFNYTVFSQSNILPNHSLVMASSLAQLSASVTRILSLTGFPKELKTRDIQLAFSEWENANGGFKIKWIDDTSLLVVFADATIGETSLRRRRNFLYGLF